jgi:hypothetical protein
MDMKKLFHVLVVGGAVIGTGGGCAKSKGSEASAAQPGSTPAATATKPDSDTNGTPTPAQPQEKKDKGGGADGW